MTDELKQPKNVRMSREQKWFVVNMTLLLLLGLVGMWQIASWILEILK